MRNRPTDRPSSDLGDMADNLVCIWTSQSRQAASSAIAESRSATRRCRAIGASSVEAAHPAGSCQSARARRRTTRSRMSTVSSTSRTPSHITSRNFNRIRHPIDPGVVVTLVRAAPTPAAPTLPSSSGRQHLKAHLITPLPLYSISATAAVARARMTQINRPSTRLHWLAI